MRRTWFLVLGNDPPDISGRGQRIGFDVHKRGGVTSLIANIEQLPSVRTYTGGGGKIRSSQKAKSDGFDFGRTRWSFQGDGR